MCNYIDEKITMWRRHILFDQYDIDSLPDRFEQEPIDDVFLSIDTWCKDVKLLPETCDKFVSDYNSIQPIEVYKNGKLIWKNQ